MALLGPLFRLLACAGVLRRFVNRQRLVHTSATNLRGPAQPLSFAGAPLSLPSRIRIIPISGLSRFSLTLRDGNGQGLVTLSRAQLILIPKPDEPAGEERVPVGRPSRLVP